MRRTAKARHSPSERTSPPSCGIGSARSGHASKGVLMRLGANRCSLWQTRSGGSSTATCSRWHRQSRRAGTNHRRSRSAAFIRNAAQQRGSHSANGSSCDAPQQHRPDDERLHRSEAARRSRGIGLAAVTRLEVITLDGAPDDASDRNGCPRRIGGLKNMPSIPLHQLLHQLSTIGVISDHLLTSHQTMTMTPR